MNEDLYKLSASVNVLLEYCKGMGSSPIYLYRHLVDGQAPESAIKSIQMDLDSNKKSLLSGLKKTQKYLEILIRSLEIDIAEQENLNEQ